MPAYVRLRDHFSCRDTRERERRITKSWGPIELRLALIAAAATALLLGLFAHDDMQQQ